MSTALERARLFKERQAAQQAGAGTPAPAQQQQQQQQQPAYASASSLPPVSSPLPPPNAQRGGWTEFLASVNAPQAPSPFASAPPGIARSPSYSPAPTSSASTAHDLSSKLVDQLKEEHARVLEQKQREIDGLRQQQQQQQATTGGPLTFDKFSSATDGLDALQLGSKADDKTVVAKYESLVRLEEDRAPVRLPLS